MSRPPTQRRIGGIARVLALVVALIVCSLLAAVLPGGAVLAGEGQDEGQDEGDGEGSRDQQLLGLYYPGRLGRLSFYGGLGFGSVRGGSTDFAPSGRLAFDLGILWDLKKPVRLGVSFDHFRFREELLGVEIPREISDLSGFVRLDGRDGILTPYLKLGAGYYFADNAERSDVYRVGLGVEVPVARVMVRLEGRYSSYGCCAFSAQSGRQTTLQILLGARLPLMIGRDARPPDDAAARLRQTLRYIAAPWEQAEIKALATDQEVFHYFDEFWRRRDPYPDVPGNPEREAFLERVEIATQHFGEMGRPGWASQRGRAIIVYGQPDEIVWEQRIPRPRTRDPFVSGLPADTRTAGALELWIYYRTVGSTDGRQSFLLFEEDAVSRYEIIWTNITGELGFGRPLPPLPATIAAPISAGL